MGQMTDNGDGTYSYSYSVSNDGAVTVIVRLITGTGIKWVWYNNYSFSGSPGVKHKLLKVLNKFMLIYTK